jgi:hypothetical protein
VAIVRNLTLIKCTPGYPMPMSGGSAVFGVVPGSRPVIVERERFAVSLTHANAALKQITDRPTPVSAPPLERRT